MDVIIEEDALREDASSLDEEGECLCTPNESTTSTARSEATLEEIRRLFEEHRYVGEESAFYQPTDLDRVTVKFMMETGACFVEEFWPITTISKVKEVLSEAFEIPTCVIVLTLNGEMLSDESSLQSLGLSTSQIAIMEITSADPFYPVLLSNVPEKMRNKRIIRVRVQVEYGEFKEVRVIIVWKLAKKPFLGGFRHKETAVEYHHAFSQTQPFPQKPYKQKNDRDTQTAWWRDEQQMTVCDRATQNYRRDYYIPWKGDVIKTAKEYVTAEEQERRRDLERKVRVIQRYVRAWLIRRMIRRASEEQRRRVAREAEQERLRIEARETRIKADIVKSTFPRRRADFEMLYSAVEQWRSAEADRIQRSQKAQATKCAEYAQVLEKEVKNLFEIEKQRLSVKQERLRRKELEVIDRCAEPITWTGYKGMKVSMDTLRNQRARELRELYSALCREEAPLESRVDLLMAVKDALVVHREPPLVDDIIELVDRECDLLVRGLNTDQLEALRARLRSLFLQLMKTPEFNPEVAKYSLEYSYKGLEFSLSLCVRCQNLLPREKFLPGNRDEQLQFCRSCRWLEKASLSRTDLTPYSFMLRALRRDEKRRRCFSSVAFIMQEDDFHYLVTNIWHARSILSENKTVRDLRMSRWDVGKDWAPWNCVLLTDAEARAHVRVTSHKVYEPGFVEDVRVRHLLARQRFRNLAEAERRFRHSGAWEKVQDDVVYCPPTLEADAFQP
ncbi:IQ and ubiquitin-like domain-containing protein [Schistocerca americana]|uniref:IQ and ubiquitin-like domain-containing protein n=1 Tax=Schistocerca americana TaxID=7009 RepID=UPI001F4F6A2D|nr:IQ and ubiquitin-like domain-containing protein [Schistocerca americana]